MAEIPLGVRIGHAHRCTVILFPEGTVASGEVRGGAPASREFDLLEPSRTVSRLDALLLAGGSAFGLAAADGVMRFCEERGMGFPTAGGPVPIVVGLGLYDLLDESPRPGGDEGYAACEAAVTEDVAVGPVGAGAAATVAKWRGREHARPGGIGLASVRDGDGAVLVAALVAVNAFGDGLQPGDDEPRISPLEVPSPEAHFGENTTIGVVLTNATLDKAGCFLTAQSGHDGMARALRPVHSRADGDALVAAATCEVESSPTTPDTVRELAATAVERAIRAAVAF